MKRTTIFLEEQLQRELKIVAEYKGVPAASVLRDALDEYLRAERTRRPRSLSFMAVGRSGREDIAERHEEILWKGLGPHSPSPKPKRAKRRR